MTLGRLLCAVRIVRGVSQKELAEALGVTPNWLSLVENDRREPSLRFLRKFAAHLQVSLGKLCLHHLEKE